MLPITAPVLLTRHEAAGLLRVHVRTLDKWVRAGRLVAVHPGPGTTRFTPQALVELIEQTTDRTTGA